MHRGEPRGELKRKEGIMEISGIKAVYFSAVGNTRKVVDAICITLSDELGVPVETVDFTLPDSRKSERTFGPEDLVIFGTPTYAGRVPNKVLPFVQTLFHGQNTPAVSVVTFGNRNFDSSLTELTEELGKNGFKVFGAGAFACRHVFSDIIADGRPDVRDMETLFVFARRIAELVDAVENADSLEVPKIRDGAPVAPYYTPLGMDGQPAKFLKAKVVTDPTKCDRCGQCARVCPMGSISHENVQEVPGVCIKCHACVRKCPRGAKHFEDPAFLSHVEYLEKNYQRRAEPEIYI